MADSEILLYQTEDGQTKIDVRLEDETVWLSQVQMAELFQTTKQNISLHIKNIFEEGQKDDNDDLYDDGEDEDLFIEEDGNYNNTTVGGILE